MPISEDYNDRAFVGISKRGWNRIAQLIIEHGLPGVHFQRSIGDSEYEGDSLTYEPTGRGIAWRTERTQSGTYWWFFEKRLPADDFRETDPIVTNDDLFRRTASWLQEIREDEDDALAPDLWKPFVAPSSSKSARIWQDDDVLKADEVQAFRERMEYALEEIKQRQLLGGEELDELRVFVEERMPEAGQKWGTWRVHMLGALTSRIVDGLTSPEVIGLIFQFTAGILSASYHLPKLIPPTGP